VGFVRGAAFAQDLRVGEEAVWVHPFHSATMLAIEDVAAADRARSLVFAATDGLADADGGADGGADAASPPTDRRTELPGYLFSGSALLAHDRLPRLPSRSEPELYGLFVPPPGGSAGTVSDRDPQPIGETYLCTGCDAFLTVEPGPMESMALVHARVARVFIGCRDTVSGALAQEPALPRKPALNHRYRVWEAAPDSQLHKACRKAAGLE
jgi:hypothetical protein